MSNVKTIDLGYRARDQFRGFHRRKERFGVVVAHRRAGKTVAAVHDLVDAALRINLKDGRFAYVAPFYAQAKDVAWVYLKRAVAPIPGVGINETELRVDLPNGSRIRLYGADNYDRLRGIYLDGVVLDEFADMDPRAWSEVIRPALADRQGWAVFIGTPKGRNAFADLYERAEADPEWFALRLRASETGIIPDSELQAMKAELSANEFRREMETDFDAAVEGAYFAEQLHAAQSENRITTLAVDPILQVRAFWDLGVSDSTAIWIAQWSGQSINWLDYIEGAGQPLGYYVEQMRKRGWENAKCILPHDGAHRDAVTATRFEDHLTAAGFAVETIPNQGRGAAIKRIEAARRLFPRMWFDVNKTNDGRRALAAYHEKRDEKRMVGLGPEHDWASHGADAFGLGCVAYEEPKAPARPRARVPHSSWMGR